jgi:hypothetical protein
LERLSFYLHDHASSFRIELRGRLTSKDLAELEGCWATAVSSIGSRSVCLDLRGLSDADEAGRGWLRLMGESQHVQVVAEQGMAAALGLQPSSHASCGAQPKSRKARDGSKLVQPQQPERKTVVAAKSQSLPISESQTTAVVP